MNNFLEKIKIKWNSAFAKYARNAFIAQKKILNSLERNNYLNLDKMNKVLNFFKYNNISISISFKTKNKNSETKSVFENLFYHLRPGTYDITVKRLISDIKKEKSEILNPYFHLKTLPKNFIFK